MQLILVFGCDSGAEGACGNLSSHFDQKLPVHYAGNEQNYISTQRKYPKLVITYILDRTFIAREYCMLLIKLKPLRNVWKIKKSISNYSKSNFRSDSDITSLWHCSSSRSLAVSLHQEIKWASSSNIPAQHFTVYSKLNDDNDNDGWLATSVLIKLKKYVFISNSVALEQALDYLLATLISETRAFVLGKSLWLALSEP